MSGVPQRQCSTTVGATPTDLKKSFTCHECGKAFNSVWYLKQHAVKHSKDRPFTCKYCSRTYRFRSNLYQHKCPQRDLASGQSQKSSRPKKKQRIDEEDRQLHSSGCLPPADTITRPMASVQDGANGHLCLLNDVQTSYVGDHKFDIYGAGDAGADTGHKCYRCCMVFPSQEYLIRHLSWHSAEERKMQCSRCSELFENELLHDAHQQLHSLDAVHMCTFCLGKFCHRLALKRHMVRCGAQRSGGSLSTSNSGSTYSPQHQHHHQQAVEQTPPPPFTPFNEFNDLSSVGSSSAGSSGFSHNYADVPESCLLTPYAATASAFGPNADHLDWAASSSYVENNGVASYVENGSVPRQQTVEAEDCWYGFDQAFVHQSAAPTDLSWNDMTPLAGAQCPLSSTATANNGEVLLSDGWQYEASNYATNGDASHAEVQKLDEYLAAGYPYAGSMDPVLMFNSTTVGGQEPLPPPAPQQQVFEGGGHVMGSHCTPYEPTSSEVTTGRCHSYVSRLEELTCATCSLLFDSLEALHNHFIRAHVLEELGTCRDGGGAMPPSGRCAASREAGNPTPTDWELLPTLCPICSVNFEGEEALRAHILSDHRPDKRFNCATCGQAFNRRQSWKRHVNACVARKNGDVDKSTAGDQLTNGSTPQMSAGGGVDARSGELKCRHCSKVFMVKRYLKQHENSQHRASMVKGVEDCGGGGGPTVAVNQQQQQDAGKEVVENKEEQALVSCPLCPKQFSVVKLLKQHVSFHARANSL